MLINMQTESRYLPQFALLPGITINDLFTHVSTFKRDQVKPDQQSMRLWLSINGFYNGISVYVVPCFDLSQCLEKLNIYGKPLNKDIYLKVFKTTEDKIFFSLQYQQIIGSYVLFELTTEQHDQLIALHKAV